ncbi:hypothetical protein FOZ62_024573 [Perkinsus olseni]|uniref:Uncharacterized protein n=1 Tax=Perkinsus olseni TaxID=32597 RepID=A0A7J6UG00_PEROL|nr:hypothetical protein FOZ62_024573 [Perkinsus olseni]
MMSPSGISDAAGNDEHREVTSLLDGYRDIFPPGALFQPSTTRNSREAAKCIHAWINAVDGERQRYADHTEKLLFRIGNCMLELEAMLQRFHEKARKKGGWTLLFGEGATKILVQRVVYYLQLGGCCSAEILSSTRASEGFGEVEAALGILRSMLAFHERFLIKTFLDTALPVCLSRLLFPVDGVAELSEVKTLLSGALGTTLLPAQTKIVDILVRMCEVGGPVYTLLLLLPSGPSTTELPTILTRLFIIFVAACNRAVSDTTDRSPCEFSFHQSAENSAPLFRRSHPKGDASHPRAIRGRVHDGAREL